MRVLVAEDDRVSALVLRRALERGGHQVTVAADGEAAWEVLLREKHRVLITDWMMPVVDGIELCRRIRARGEGPYVYAIVLTAKATRDDRLDALEAGADDFLCKPLDTAELAARLSVAERILGMEQELQCRVQALRDTGDELAAAKEQLEVNSVVLEAANKQFEEILEGMPAACMTFDLDRRLRRWNRDCERLFGRSMYQAAETSLEDLLPWWRDNSQGRAALERAMRDERTEGIEWMHTCDDGRVLRLLSNIIPQHGLTGGVCGAISASVDITERKALEERLAHELDRVNGLNEQLGEQQSRLEDLNLRLAEQAITDGLTGLYNHRHFRAVLDDRFRAASSTRGALSVVLLDVDHFKSFNDSFGHLAGDEVLRGVADELTRGAGADDLVARYGGEEFVVLLPAAGTAAALRMANRLRLAIERRYWPLRPITASFGVSTLTRRTASASELVEQADQAMYASKRAGRNRVTHFEVVKSGTETLCKAA